jgi:hypothetical protein
MIAIAPSDVVPMAEFPLAWRFTDDRWRQLPADARKDVRPLSATKAAELEPRLAAACVTYHHGEQPPGIHIPAPCENAADVDRTRRALAALPIDDGERIVVGWDRALALETSWRTFTALWEAFCYPGTDDVTISPLGERWVLCYHHWEAFSFAPRPSAPTGGGAPTT